MATTHRGEIVEKAMRRSGYSLTKLAGKLGISRNTLYHRFENPDLSYQFIMQVGATIAYDFTLDFPEMKEGEDLADKIPTTQPVGIGEKYIYLLEKYASLLAILAKIAHQTELPALRQEIDKMLAEEAEGGHTHQAYNLLLLSTKFNKLAYLNSTYQPLWLKESIIHMMPF